MATLNETDLITELKGLLKLPPSRGDARLSLVLRLATREILDNLGPDMGIKTTNTTIKYLASDDNNDEQTYITLPSDVGEVMAVFYGDVQIRLTSPVEFLKVQKSSAQLTKPFFGSLRQLEGGNLTIDIYPKGSNFEGQNVEVVYRSNGDDVSVLPVQYKLITLLGAAKHFTLWDNKNDPKIHSQFESAFKKEMARVNNKESYKDRDALRFRTLSEQRWWDSFNDVTLSRSTDLGF